MALSSALYTGLSGLDVNQTKLNVVGNNIANVNTVAFKSSRALFKPQFYVTDAAGSPADGEFGGTNPSQRGLGAAVATIQRDFAGGSIEPTGKDTDMAIEGDGFFVVRGKEQVYTRDGSFGLNAANELVTTDGQHVQGYGVDAAGNVNNGAIQDVVIPVGALTTAKATENASFVGNLKADGPVAAGASITNSQPMTSAAGTPDDATPLTDLLDAGDSSSLFADGDVLTLDPKKGGRSLAKQTLTVGPATTLGDLQAFLGDNLGLDGSVAGQPAGLPTAGVGLTPTVAGDPANSVRLMVVSNPGADNAVSLAGTGFVSSAGSSPLKFDDGPTATDGGTPPHVSDATAESVHTTMVAYDSLGTQVAVDVTAVLESKSGTGTTWRFYAASPDNKVTGTAAGDPTLLGNGTLTFDNNGKLTGATGNTLAVSRAGTGAGSPVNVKMDFSGVTSLSDRTGKSSLTVSQQDGQAKGTLSSFSIGENGIITGAFTNGLTQTLGQIAVATFNNPEGLQDDGGNMFSTGANSGVPVIGVPLDLGAGSVRSGALELSNVDLSKEFVNMITASTGFSAASRVITTSDQLIQELLNTAR